MKKIIALLLALTMVFALCACGKSATKLTYATGGTSGTYYGFSGVIANVLNEKLKDTLNLNVESTGASKANIQLLASGDADIAIVQNDVMYYAYTATDLFAGGDAITSFSAVCSCYPEYVQILARKDVTSVDQLRGLKVSVGDAGSGTEFNAKQILAAYGMSFDDIVVSNQSFADSADSLKNGTIDAAFVVAGYPTTAVTELATSFDFNLLPIDDADAFQHWLLNEFNDQGETVMFACGEPFYATPGKGKNEVRMAYVLKAEDLSRAMDILAVAIEKYNKR